MTNDPNDDLYEDEPPAAQRVGDGPAGKAEPTKLENIAALTSGPKTGKVIAVTAGAVVLVAALIAVGFMSRSNGSKPLPDAVKGANVGTPPGLSETPSALAASPQYRSMVDEVEKKRIAEARASGRSVQPSAETLVRDLKPTEQESRGPGPNGAAQNGQASLPTSGPLPPTSQPVAYQANPQDPAVQAQMQSAQQAVAAIIASQKPRGAQTFVLADPAPAGPRPAHQAGAENAAAPRPVAVAAAAPVSRTLIQAGTIEAVRLDSGINTDLPGEFVATLVTGPYAGSRLVGSARRSGTLAGLQFRSLSLAGRGVTIPINATGIDAATMEPGTATEVDRKLMTKYLLKPLAAGIAAVGEATLASGTTVVVNPTSTVSSTDVPGEKAGRIAVGAAAAQISSDAEALDTTPTVRVARGAVVGVMFTADVVYTPRGN